MTDLIALEAVTKTFRRHPFAAPHVAVRAVSLAMQAGEVFGFVGPNGAGKSTTIKMILGLLRPTAGSVRLLGYTTDDPRSREGLGYVMENPSLPDFLTPLELLQTAMTVKKGVRNAKSLCLGWLDRFGIAAAANRQIGGFSKGMVQRTALAHAMVGTPRLLILDEPLSGLDPVGRKDVVDILEDYKRAGGAIFFTSHVLHDVERIADRFALIHQGILRTVRDPRELVRERHDLFIVRFDAPASIAGAREVRSGRYEVECAQSGLSDLLANLHTRQGTLVEVRPAESLETVFMRLVSEPNEAQGAQTSSR